MIDKSDALFSRKVCGSIKYIKLTPSWHREEVKFILGQKLSNGLAFTARELPTKNVVRSRGNKKISCTIPVSWIAKKRRWYTFSSRSSLRNRFQRATNRSCSSTAGAQRIMLANFHPETGVQSTNETRSTKESQKNVFFSYLGF